MEARLKKAQWRDLGLELMEQDLSRPYGAPWVTGVTVGDEPKPAQPHPHKLRDTDGCGEHAQPHLVPVRKGGPWQVDGKWAEVWRNGEYVDGADRGFVIVDGDWRYAPFTPKHPALSGIALRVQAGDELRPKKDWTGDLPEGTRLATDFVVGQRVRCDKTEGHIVERDERYCTEGTIPVRWPTHTAHQMDPNRLEGY